MSKITQLKSVISYTAYTGYVSITDLKCCNAPLKHLALKETFPKSFSSLSQAYFATQL